MHFFKEQQRKLMLLLMLKCVQDLKVKCFCSCIPGISFAIFCKARHTNSSSGGFEDKIVNRMEKKNKAKSVFLKEILKRSNSAKFR